MQVIAFAMSGLPRGVVPLLAHEVSQAQGTPDR